MIIMERMGSKNFTKKHIFLASISFIHGTILRAQQRK
ncbi:hypothetical protein DVH24_001249 [Malus domestica]|uniref:Uncharacterized protein n=1 Tax=Malus domestica TaxID=3750 RepID=A0A498K4U6_MALDO|nr:hypothetical protein DVH24_001249 [Malus domestica]